MRADVAELGKGLDEILTGGVSRILFDDGCWLLLANNLWA
jgi:hypothetical protein